MPRFLLYHMDGSYPKSLLGQIRETTIDLKIKFS